MTEFSDFLKIYSFLNKALDRKTKLAYNEYKRIMVKYVDAIGKSNRLKWMMYKIGTGVNSKYSKQLIQLNQNIDQLRKDAVRIERFVKEINPGSKLPFLDVD